MGEDRAVWNLTKCEYLVVNRNWPELVDMARGINDWAEWALNGGFGLAVLLGLTPYVESPLGFYEKVWGRWHGDRLVVTGDYTRADARVAETCKWTNISSLVDLAIAELFMHMAKNTVSRKERERYRGTAIWLLTTTLPRTVSTVEPSYFTKKLAEIVAETGSYSLALDVVISEIDDLRQYCEKVIAVYPVPAVYKGAKIYVASNCLRLSMWDEQLEMLDRTRVFETDLLNDYTAVPSDVATAWNGFLRIEEECPDSADC